MDSRSNCQSPLSGDLVACRHHLPRGREEGGEEEEDNNRCRNWVEEDSAPEETDGNVALSVA